MSRLLYGEVVDTGLIFMPEAEAQELANLQRAICLSKTWGEFRKRAGEARYAAVMKNRECPNFEDFFTLERQSRRKLTEDKARQEYWALPRWMRLPLEEEPFSSGEVPGLCDGVYPEWPAQEALKWFPRDIIRDYGRIEDSIHNGSFLSIPTDSEKPIVSILSLIGYICTRDDKTIMNASGYVSESDD